MSIRYGRKISELAALTTASLQNTYVVGIDNGVTYKMSLDILEDAVTNMVSTTTDARLDSLEAFTSSNSIPTRIANINSTASVGTDFENTFKVEYNGENLLLINQSGSVAINTTQFDENNPETLLIVSHDDTNYNLIVGRSNTNNYSQFNLKNQNTGSLASSDIVATTDTGDENQGYIDMGINSSTYYNPYFVGRARDAYLYSTGDDLWIGNASANKRIALFSGGPDAEANAKVYIHPQGVIGVNTSDTASSVSPALPALLVRPAVSDTYNMIYVESDVNNYSQLNIQNVNGGVSASSDIVATNDIGTETSYYIDMGVNGSGYINNGNGVASANDAYLYSTANHLHIGNASNYPLMFFAGGFNADANQKMLLSPDNNHSITGSLDILIPGGSAYGQNENPTSNNIFWSYPSQDVNTANVQIGWIAEVQGGGTYTVTNVEVDTPYAPFISITLSDPSLTLGYRTIVNFSLSSQLWKFNTDGTLRFPDSSSQSTAFTGFPTGLVSSSQQISQSGFVSSSTVSTIQTITSASYSAITPVSGVLYIIID